MKYKHLFWAIILIAVGVIFILNNFGVLNFSWYNFWQLWPLVLILWGISILPVKDMVKFTMLVGVILIAIVFINRLPEHRPWFSHFHRNGDMSWEWDDDDETAIRSNAADQNLSVPFDSLAGKGILNLDAAAGTFTFSGETPEFLAFSKTGDIGNYELTTHDTRNVKNISLRLEDNGSKHRFNKNHVNIKLNQKPVWDLKFNIGAASMDMDLSNYRIDTADFDAGASSITLKLGDKNPLSVVTFNAGASSIHLSVPKSAGCQVSSESFLVSKSFEGFSKKEGHIYETENFARASSKIFVTVKTAVSSIDITRY
jgi:hypothetical protein